ncbi:adenosylcobinamide-GDP ribazoletransferase [Roseobacter sp. HKCCA0434]|uniref:adenosylcobinamide-GDP ribazoletransferase n=1 Tax=Roseobacter sp. HKCCA0434 TaxID=3079297 RepID=UPI002905E9D3|nr:adenosylcobinamide-GDP ribazoletransferase [Roseobacter sp. HKCCA0434]
MTDTRRDGAFQLHDIAAGFGLLTRLPVPVDHARAGARGAEAGWAWPLVGATVALLAGLPSLALAALGMPMPVCAGIAITLSILATGALHEDGLADCADGLGSGAPRDRALEIMKDSRVGAFGAVALVLAIGLRWQALASLDGWTFLAVLVGGAAASRAAMLVAMRALPPARDGLSAASGRPPLRTTLIACAIALLLTLPGGWLVLALLPGAALATLMAAYASRRLGGQTGDVLGAVQQGFEIGMLVAATAILA